MTIRDEEISKLLINDWHALDVESALNQEVGTTIPAIVSDLQEDNVSGYSAYEFKVEPIFKGVPRKTLLDPKFWQQFIDE